MGLVIPLRLRTPIHPILLLLPPLRGLTTLIRSDVFMNTNEFPIENFIDRIIFTAYGASCMHENPFFAF